MAAAADRDDNHFAFYDWDLASHEMFWSGALSVLFDGEGEGLSIPRSAWLGRIVAGDRALVDAEIARLIAGDIAHADLQYVVRSAGGERRVLDRAFAVRQQGRVCRLIGTIKPVTAEAAERDVSVEERLRDSEARFRTFVEFLPLLAWETDAEGWIDYYNARWYEYTGTTPVEMQGWGWISVHVAEDLPRMLKVFRNALITGQPWEDEFRLRRADGVFRWHLSRAMPLRDVQGRIVRWFGTNTDIHDQKLALEERQQLYLGEQRLRVEAERANRAKDEFLAVVSHELRSPLNAVLGWAQMLTTGALPEARRDAAIEKIETNGRFLARLIGDLLDVSRIVSGRLTIEANPVDVTIAVELAIDGVRTTADAKGITIAHRKPADPVFISGSSQRLQQVFTNLLTNAIKFSPPDTEVIVKTTVDDAWVTVRVTDHGEGIDPAFLPHLFGRFTQGDASQRRRHGGLGLGLSIAKHLTELHGGTTEASSAGIGQGAEFVVRLPATVGADAPIEMPQKLVTRASLVGLKVLAVDDDVEARDVVASVLLSCGATVTVVGSVAESFAALRVEMPDVIVSDLSMPEVDGYGLLERLRGSTDARLVSLPIVALTAVAGEDSRRRTLERGFDAFLTKPLDAALLSHTLLDIARARVGKSSS